MHRQTKFPVAKNPVRLNQPANIQLWHLVLVGTMRATTVTASQPVLSEEHQCLIIFFYEASFVDIILFQSWLCSGRVGYYFQDCPRWCQTWGLSVVPFSVEHLVEPKLHVLASHSLAVSWQMSLLPSSYRPSTRLRGEDRLVVCSVEQMGLILHNKWGQQFFMSIFQMKSQHYE